MLRKITNWYREWEDEQLRVLEQPALAAEAPAGYRRRIANKLAKLSPIERQQLREFSIKYRGWRLFVAIARLIVLFTVAGAALHMAMPNLGWWSAIWKANLVGFAIVWGTIGVWFNYRWLVDRKRQVFVRFITTLILGVPASAAILGLVQGRPPAAILERLAAVMGMAALGASALVLIPVLIIAVLRNRHHEALTLQLQRDAERDRLARELSESQLRLLRAQIEPHFLFNTLGAVQQLAQHGAPRAAELTANLITFLRASLAEMRTDQVSLQQEFALVEAYLAVMKVRLGERLRATLDLPPALAQVCVPSMIVLTLAENAIKHGIEPSLRGGEVAISAELVDGAARIRVRDSGAGISSEPVHGVGLENVRSRLRLAHGDAASLTMHDAEQGALAEIIVPIGAAK
jgi:signal transduction histidine kinase